MNSIFGARNDRPSRHRIIAFGWVIFVCAILTGFTALFGFLLIDQRHRDWEQAEVSARNLTESVQRDILHALQSVDRTLMAVRELAALDAGFKFDPSRRRTLLGDTPSAPGLGEIYLLDRNGAVILRSETGMRVPTNFANEPFFYSHARSSDDRLFTARTVTISPLGEVVVMMSRRMTGRDGGFAGVVAFSLRLSSFDDLFRSLDLGDNGAISLYGTDGTLLLRAPDVEGMTGRNFVAAPMFWQLATAKAPFAAASPIDKVERLYSAMQIGDLPLIIAVGLSVADIYVGWEKLAVMTSAFFVALTACVILLSVLLAIELRRRRHSESRYRKLAHVDGLTGLFNRRRFDSVLETEFSRARRMNAPLSVVMIDVDRFKLFNDLYGHQTGDDCLKAIAEAIRSHLKRPADMAARYGGEEIALILPDTDEAGAASVAEGVRRAIEEMQIPHARNDSGCVTASLGTATGLPGRPETAASLVAKADEALYGAKRSGRNRVIAGAIVRSGIPARPPANEGVRIERVKAALSLLSQEDRQALDRITKMAAQAFATKMAFVTLVDTAEQFFVGRTGLLLDRTSRDVSFCAYALGSAETFVVLDAMCDIRFSGNPLVTGEPHMRFYAGAPLCDAGTGAVLGTLCVIDPSPRPAFSDSQRDLLSGFAALALEQLHRSMQTTADPAGPLRASA